MADRGWVATHDDITERRDAERERAAMQQQQQQRGIIEQAIAAFRQRVEDLLRTVTEGAMAMRATAATLLGNSGQTSKSAESAVTASNEASVNVETASVAADELTGSISEIGRQLSLTTDVVRAAVGEAQGTNRQIAAMAQPAEKPAAEKPEKPAKKPRQKKAETAEGAEVVEAAEGAEKPAKKPKAEKAETAEGAKKPAKKPRAKSTKKAKGEAAEAAAPEAGEKPSGE